MKNIGAWRYLRPSQIAMICNHFFNQGWMYHMVIWESFNIISNIKRMSLLFLVALPLWNKQ